MARVKDKIQTSFGGPFFLSHVMDCSIVDKLYSEYGMFLFKVKETLTI